MIRKIFTIFGVLAVLLSVFATTSGPAFAVTFSSIQSTSVVPPTRTTNTPVNFDPISKTCTLIEVHLNGPSHTITCSKAHAKNISTVIPAISRDNSCNVAGDAMNIFNYNWTSLLCFYGTGYMGVAIYKVNEIDDIDPSRTGYPSPDWFRYYDQWGGHFLGQQPGDVAGFGPTGVYVTQLCIGSSNGGHC